MGLNTAGVRPGPVCSRGAFRLTLGSSMKLGLAVEMSLSVFKEQFTSCERMSHAASADSLLLSTCPPQTRFKDSSATADRPPPAAELAAYLKADVLQVVGVAFDDLFDQVWVRGLQVGARRLVQLKLKASPQFWHVENLVPAPTHLWKKS